MTRSSKVKSGTATLDEMLGEASWFIAHAEALADYGCQAEAGAELARAARAAGLELRELGGIEYNPFTRSARLGPSVEINYLAHFSRPVAAA